MKIDKGRRRKRRDGEREREAVFKPGVALLAPNPLDKTCKHTHTHTHKRRKHF